MINKLIKSGLFIGFICLAFSNSTFSQEIEIPDRFEFAGIRLKIKAPARRQIEARVNGLQADTVKFKKQVKVADLYLPLIANILKDTGLPEDFKYLALMDNTQPDSLLFWQMASQQASKLGLNINASVDERLNILTASKAIANHLQKNQSELKNWIFTLLSYHLEVGEVKSYLQNLFPKLNPLELINLNDFDVDVSSHPDILAFLSYHFAFRPYLGKNINPEVELVSFDNVQGKSLSEIAKTLTLPEAQLKNYNTWLKAERIPFDKNYEAIIPMPTGSPTSEVNVSVSRGGELIYETQEEEAVHIVKSGETLYRISRIYNVKVEEIKQWNQLSGDNLDIGQKLVLQNKVVANTPSPATVTPTPSNPAQTAIIHTVEKGETLYRISQKYNVEVFDIKSWNDLFSNDLNVGQKLKINVLKESIPKTPKVTPPVEIPPQPQPNNSGGSQDLGSIPAIPPVYTPNKPRTLKTKSIPSRMTIGNVSLVITEEGRRLLESDVKTLTRNEKYFFENLQRVDLYAPLIQEVLRGEGVPMDFQYLPIQESELIANAVSRSQAVGYWQFKAPSAVEVGMTVNNKIDERMHIIEATDGAAKYFLRSQAYFDNWVFTLLSFNMGFTGAKNFLERQYPRQNIRGMREIKIDGNTHWYIRKFLAHKIAFETEIGLDKTPYYLRPQIAQARRTLKQIAQEQGCEDSITRLHNQWLKDSTIPTDKSYFVILPLK